MKIIQKTSAETGKTYSLFQGHVNHATATRSGERSRYTDKWSVVVSWTMKSGYTATHIHTFNSKSEAICWFENATDTNMFGGVR